ncbi:helix-turn-helix domain-containing protein [Streptomyces sp. NPDC000151]|uniref:AraC-like ligand-binding domain-containing protein n=1 Tax=Streptomyces sp. NPDC000151 TaxID=3154244 RepID=UPI00331C8D84
MQTVIATDQVPDRERFAYWSRAVAEAMHVVLDVPGRGSPRTAFHGRAALAEVGGVRLRAMRAAPVAVRRTAPMAARHAEDYYKVLLQISGTVAAWQGAEAELVGPGELVVCDAARPYELTYRAPFSTAMIMIPRDRIPLRPEALRAVTGRRIDGSDGVGAVLGPHLRSLVRHGAQCAPHTGARLADSTVSLVTALLAEQLDRVAPAEPGQALLLRIRDHIERRLADPGLNPEGIAQAHGISRRYLFKLFSAQGMTVAGWIRAQRLQRCARDLADPALCEVPVATVAARWGLTDARHFSRTFKSVYGCAPGAYRARQGLPPRTAG